MMTRRIFFYLILSEYLSDYRFHHHDYRQGLVYENGLIWEGTGLYGQSKVRLINATTSQVLAEKSLTDDYFGELVVI